MNKSIVKEKAWGWPAACLDLPVWGIYCPGCQHPTVARLIAEVTDELGVGDRVILVMGVGCHAFAGFGLNFDTISSCHGRAPDLATAVKRIYPDTIVFNLQGDGDCIAIGAGPFIAALTRGEMITVIMLNNNNYGTTGGQLAPTTLMGQRTSTSPEGRIAGREGFPAHVAELAAGFKGTAYSARGALNTIANYQRTKRYIKTAFKKQIDNVGFSFVEVLSACPANWHLTPLESLKWIEEKVIPEFPLGEFRNVDRIE